MDKLLIGINSLTVGIFLLSLLLVFIYIEINYWSRKLNKKMALQKEQIESLMQQLAERR